MRLSDAMAIPKGITAVVGGGGKTTLIRRLAQELSESHTVLIATTTHIWPPDCHTLILPSRSQIADALREERLLAIGDPTPEGKLTAVQALQNQYEGLADYVLIEADGSRGFPLKAPAEHEPVLPDGSAMVIAVAGMDCMQKTIREAAHRPLRYAALCGLSQEDTVTPEAAACVLSHPMGQRKGVRERFVVALNQVDTPSQLLFARQIAIAMREEVYLLALQTKPNWSEHWKDGQQLKD